MVFNKAHREYSFCDSLSLDGAGKSTSLSWLSSIVAWYVVVANVGGKYFAFEADPMHKTWCKISIWFSGYRFSLQPRLLWLEVNTVSVDMDTDHMFKVELLASAQFVCTLHLVER